MKTKKLFNVKKLTVLITLAILVIFFSGCEKGVFCISGKGEIVSSTITVAEFSEIEASGAFDVVVTEGDIQIVEIVGHQNMIDKVNAVVIHDRLEVDLKRGCYNDYELTIYVTTPDIQKVKLSGSGEIVIEEFNELEKLDLIIDGSGNINGEYNFPINNLSFLITGSGNINFKTTSLNITSTIDGSGNVNLSGTTGTHDIKVEGSGSFHTFDLISDNTSIYVEGSGDSEVNVNENLDIDIFGSGDVYYKGHPNLTINISGSGNVYNAN